MKYASYKETCNDEGGEHKYVFTSVPCPMCSSQEEIAVGGEDLFWYNQGKLMQEAFPYLTANQRERLMSGMCGKCYDNLT